MCAHSVVSDSLRPHGLQPASPRDFSGKNTGVGCYFFLQGIFPIQRSNPHLMCLLHRQADSLPSEPPGKPIEVLGLINKLMYMKCLVQHQVHSKYHIGVNINYITVKNLPSNEGDTEDMGSIPGSGRSPGGRNSNPFRYSCLENSMDRGAWQSMGLVEKSQTQLTD